MSVIKAAGANGGISSHADSLHHWTDMNNTDTQMRDALIWTLTHACISRGQSKYFIKTVVLKQNKEIHVETFDKNATLNKKFNSLTEDKWVTTGL